MEATNHISLQNYQLIAQLFLFNDDIDRRLLQGFGLSVARFNLLGHLAARSPLSATDLCGLLLCDKANVTRLLDGLEQDGLVERTPHPEDGRRISITLTPAGKQRWIEADQAHQVSAHARFECLTLSERNTLNALLNRVSQALPEQIAKL